MEKYLPPVEEMREAYSYDPETGLITRKPRHPETFDPELYDPAKQAEKWNRRWAGKKCFNSVDSNGYLRGSHRMNLFKAHRVAWALHTGEWPDGEIDHINHDRKDNRFANLRVVSHAENGKNLARNVRAKSGKPGVTWYAPRGKWCAKISVTKQIHLGYFDDLPEAIAAREEAEREHGYHKNHGK